jgi:hypothetical protein
MLALANPTSAHNRFARLIDYIGQFFSFMQLNDGQGLGSGQVLELCGESSSGKSTLLAYMIAKVLITTLQQSSAGSAGDAPTASAAPAAVVNRGRIVLFDLDFRFDVGLLARILAAMLVEANRSSSAAISHNEGGTSTAGLGQRVAEQLAACLERVDVRRPTNSTQLAADLEALVHSAQGHARTQQQPAPHAQQQQGSSLPDQPQASGHILMLALDGFGAAWHWQDKAWRTAGGSGETAGKLARAIARITQTYYCRVVWCRPLLFGQHAPAHHRTISAEAEVQRVAKLTGSRAVTLSGSLVRAGAGLCPLMLVASGAAARSSTVSQLELSRLHQNYLSSHLQKLVSNIVMLTRVGVTLNTLGSVNNLPQTAPEVQALTRSVDLRWFSRLQGADAAAPTDGKRPVPVPRPRLMTVIAARALVPSKTETTEASGAAALNRSFSGGGTDVPAAAAPSPAPAEKAALQVLESPIIFASIE